MNTTDKIKEMAAANVRGMVLQRARVRKNGRLWDMLGVGKDGGRVVFTGSLKEVREGLVGRGAR